MIWRRDYPQPNKPHRRPALDAGFRCSFCGRALRTKAAGPRVKHGATGRGLARELGRDTKSVHREVAMLTATGLIERRAADEVAVGWDRAVTELDLAA